MRRLICVFVVHIWQKQVFSWRGSYHNAFVSCKPGPHGVGDSGVIGWHQCHNFISATIQQCPETGLVIPCPTNPDIVLHLLSIISLFLAKAWQKNIAPQCSVYTRALHEARSKSLLLPSSIRQGYMSLIMRKPVFGVFDQVRLKPPCAETEVS